LECSTNYYLYLYVDGLEGISLKCSHPRKNKM